MEDWLEDVSIVTSVRFSYKLFSQFPHADQKRFDCGVFSLVDCWVELLGAPSQDCLAIGKSNIQEFIEQVGPVVIVLIRCVSFYPVKFDAFEKRFQFDTVKSTFVYWLVYFAFTYPRFIPIIYVHDEIVDGSLGFFNLMILEIDNTCNVGVLAYKEGFRDGYPSFER